MSLFSPTAETSAEMAYAVHPVITTSSISKKIPPSEGNQGLHTKRERDRGDRSTGELRQRARYHIAAEKEEDGEDVAWVDPLSAQFVGDITGVEKVACEDC